MGIKDTFEKAKQLAAEHGDKTDQGVDKAAEAAKKRTGGKYDEHIDTARERASDSLRQRQEADQDDRKRER